MSNKLTDTELQKIIPLIENTKWHYKLDQFSTASLKEINKSVARARREVSKKLATINPKSTFTKERLNDIAIEMQDMTVAIQSQITGQIERTTIAAGAKAYPKHAEIMSFGGLVPNFNNVALTAVQLKSIINTPVGGKVLKEWVDTAFTANLKDTFKSEIATGLLKGESYRNLVNRFDTKAFKGLGNDIEGLTRTYVQSINVNAMNDTMAANADIIKGWKWNSVYENRTCQRCLSMDSKNEIYPINGGPEMPLHINCRCFKEPITKTFRELGVDIDEVKDSYRPYTIRGKIDPITGKVIPGKIGVGGGRIIETGRFLGDYNSFFKSLDKNVQLQMLGPTRLGLWKSGKYKLADFTDKNGKTLLLKDLTKKKTIERVDKKVKKVVEYSIIKLDKKGIKQALNSIKGMPSSREKAYIESSIRKAGTHTVYIRRDAAGKVNAATAYKITKEGADIDTIGSFGFGGGTDLIKKVSTESQKAGRMGSIVLTPEREINTINFYIKKGFDDRPGSIRFYLTSEIATKMGYIQ